MTTALPADPAGLGPVTGHLEGDAHTRAVVCPVNPLVTDHEGWIARHGDRVRACLRDYGAVLLTGLPVDLALFAAAVRSVGGEPLGRPERSPPRTEVEANIYTSTEYPPDQVIPIHNENSSGCSTRTFANASPAASATPARSARASA